MIDNYVVSIGRWHRRIFQEFEKCLAGIRPALLVVFGGEGDGVGKCLSKRDHGYFAVYGPNEFLRGGEYYIEIEGDENTI